MLRRVLAGALLWGAAVAAQALPVEKPFPGHKVAGNLYYVGGHDYASFLVVTPAGNILINSGPQTSLPIIKGNVENLGFKWTDTKILLISHAHWDHDAGSAEIVKETGAKYMVMDGDVNVVESGGATDFAYADVMEDRYPPTKVDRTLHDGDKVTLGGSTLVAHKTPGHTHGCTTWTMQVKDGHKVLNAVIVGSPNVNPHTGFELVNNKKYPQIAEDYRKSFAIWKSLPCDLFLGAHGNYYGLDDKYPKLKQGGANPFIDPDGYKAWIASKERQFQATLAKETAAAKQ